MKKVVIGIDEVGRGPLAGPVMVCALALNQKIKKSKNRPPLRDSKRLSAKQRESWYQWIKNQDDIYFEISRVYPKTIDRINIREATNLAATRACARLCKKVKSSKKILVLLDGGLFMNQKTLVASGYWLEAQTVIGGDDTIPVIQLASIVAKVTRDRYMKKLHKQFPQYGFDVHKGYGTSAHIRAVKRYGLCAFHRKSFTHFT